MDYNTKENFNINELSLLKNYENNLVRLNLKIAEQENKKIEIMCFLDTVSKIDSNNLSSSTHSQKSYLKQITEFSKSISTNIDRLNSLKAILLDINNLFVSMSDSNNYSANDVQILKDKINNYITSIEEIQKSISLIDIEIDSFVKKINSIDGTNIANNSSSEILDENKNIIDDKNIIDNNILIISEKENKVFLPYTISEIKSYIEKYPREYRSLDHVINKEFVLPLDYYTRHPSLSRFREAYSLIRDREAQTVFDALKYGLNVMFKYDLNPAIISACKTEEALDFYLECLESKELSKFNLFKIQFKLNPMKTPKFEIKV